MKNAKYSYIQRTQTNSVQHCAYNNVYNNKTFISRKIELLQYSLAHLEKLYS